MRRRGIGRVGRPSVVGTMARTAVIAGTATAVSGSMQRSQQAKAEQSAQAQAYEAQQQQAEIDAAVAQQLAAQAPASAAPAPAAGGLTDELVGQLKQLAELRDAGILTEEEFSAKKTKLLGL
jgi:ABC-type cobalamin transport system ATPase subunit